MSKQCYSYKTKKYDTYIGLRETSGAPHSLFAQQRQKAESYKKKRHQQQKSIHTASILNFTYNQYTTGVCTFPLHRAAAKSPKTSIPAKSYRRTIRRYSLMPAFLLLRPCCAYTCRRTPPPICTRACFAVLRPLRKLPRLRLSLKTCGFSHARLALRPKLGSLEQAVYCTAASPVCAGRRAGCTIGIVLFFADSATV